ncbi:uncharacterized protein LOC144316412 isoform X5 [Canis aureus]
MSCLCRSLESRLSVDFAAPVFFYLPDFKENFKLMCSSFCMFSSILSLVPHPQHTSASVLERPPVRPQEPDCLTPLTMHPSSGTNTDRDPDPL